MAWIEVHQALRDHRKILDLSEALDLPEPYIVGNLIYLWLWAVDNAPDGVLPKSRRIIEKAAAWQGQQGRFVDALITCELLDDDQGVLSIHDWDDYVGKLIDQRQSNAARQRAHRQREKAKKNAVTDSNTTVTVTSPSRNGATVPNSTQHNRTEPLSHAHTRTRENDDERESSSATQDKDDEATPNAPSDLDEKRRRNGIKGACVDAWGKPDAAERGLWDSGITQLFDAEYTAQQVRDAIPLYEQRRPKAARTPSGLARNIRAVLSEARASPQVTIPATPGKSPQVTQEEEAAAYAKILNAFGE
jgi:hypothetical protein